MEINQLTPESEILKELARRLASIRKAQGFSQTQLAEHAGIGVATLRRIEGGQDSQLETWVKILKALDMASAVNALLPENFRSPMAEVRAGSAKKQQVSEPSAIKWGDEL